MMAEWDARWSGCWPNLCSGEWTLYRDGEKVDVEIPFQGTPADTFGVYSRWYFVGWIENFEDYESGMEAEQWCDCYGDWLSSFAPEEEWEAVYEAFQCEDWRYGSCEGCI